VQDLRTSFREGGESAAGFPPPGRLDSAAIYSAADVMATARYSGYSATDQAVSELFAIGAPTSGPVVTLFSVSSGLLLAFAGGIWWSAGGDRRLRRLAVLGAAGALEALVLWNFFPMHMRGAAHTAADTVHLLLAANPFVPLGIIVAPSAFRGCSECIRSERWSCCSRWRRLRSRTPLPGRERTDTGAGSGQGGSGSTAMGCGRWYGPAPCGATARR
jgi:hypothetical protein